MSSLTLTNLTKAYAGGARAVDDVSLEIHDGEFLVLVGPSGCGKSTTLRMIAGLEEITSGEIRIGDRRVNGVPPKDRNISMVFQNYALYPHMSVRKNMSFGLELRYGGGLLQRTMRRLLHSAKASELNTRRSGIKAQVEQTADMLQISHLLARMPGQLSGGERQRVALGRAIVREPEVFLFDEPLSNLDAKLRVEMRRELKQLHRRLGTTMIYVTHDQVEAMTLGDRVAVMRDGSLQQVGPPLELYDRPANQFVASFMGSPSMNLLAGELVAQGGELTLRLPALTILLPRDWQKELIARNVAELTLGIRPEDIQLAEASEPVPSGAIGVPGEVLLVESLGDTSLVTVGLCGKQGVELPAPGPELIVKTNRAERLQTGEKKLVIFSSSRMHLFAGEQYCRMEIGET